MRSIVAIAFGVIFLNTFICAQYVPEKTLGTEIDLMHQMILYNPATSPIWSKIKSVDFDCVKERIKVTENFNRIINETILMTSLVPSFAICSGNVKDFAGLLVNDLTDSFSSSTILLDKEDCFKLVLQDYEPDAVVLKGFDKSKVVKTLEECELAINKKGFLEQVDKWEGVVGNIEQFTCGVIKKEEIIRVMIKMPIIGFKKLDEGVGNEAKNELTEELTGKAEKLEECMQKLISNAEIANQL